LTAGEVHLRRGSVADQPKYKSPEELGEAVGKKIEELFGGLFGDEKPSEQSAPTPPPPRPAVKAPEPSAVQARPPVRETPKPPPAPTHVAAPSRPLVGTSRGDSFEDVIEQIEILVLNMEWEVSPESVRGLSVHFKRLAGHFPQEGQARTILAMNQRVLQRFSAPESVPHPALLKLLQESVGALKLIHSSKGRRPLNETLVAGLTSSYKEIMASTVHALAKPSPEAAAKPYAALVNNVGTAIHSLEEVSRRLARILGVLRQGGNMSGEEITRRLKTLESLLAEKVGQLSLYHRELAESAPPGAQQQKVETLEGPDGLLMLMWSGLNLAIPSKMVAAIYPLTKAQAEQFGDKTSITLGSRPIQRLPLKKPTNPPAHVLPGWLVHLSRDQKDYFLLAERSLGFRRTPEGVDISKQSRLKLGPTVYVVLNEMVFHR